MLGLDRGASAADVRAAFRHLAHVCHPDVAGQNGTQRFQKITGAYALLKGLSTEELEKLTKEDPPQPDVEQGHPPKTLFDWYRKRAARLDEKQARSGENSEYARREAQRRGVRVDLILDQYDQRLSRHLEQLELNRDEGMVECILSRLKSSIPEVRCLALGRAGAFISREDVFQAVTDVLNRWDVDEGTARLVSGLPLDSGTRCRLAGDVAGHAASFPNSLLTSLLGLRQTEGKPDLSLMERYLSTVAPDGVALIMRHWPAGQSPSDATLRHLLASNDPQVLVPVLSAMKQHFPRSATNHKRRLAMLKEHPAPAVRVWGRVLSEGAAKEGRTEKERSSV
ncbi:MAG: J domain-containing protein [Fretibacterium sp.]|nr:J domain-containing protein [Fretibacterium sp.]